MAVTQQLARLTEPQLDTCRASVVQIDRLCSFELLPRADHLDLDWAPSMILKAAVLSDLPATTIAAIEDSCEGDDEVNPAYRDVPHSIWEHPVAGVSEARVLHISAALAGVSQAALVQGVADDPKVAAAQLGSPEFDGSIAAWVSHQFSLLTAFYDEAAQRGLAVAVWWD